jgi:hypothetical protein
MGGFQARALPWIMGCGGWSQPYADALHGTVDRPRAAPQAGEGLNVSVQTSAEPLTELTQPATPQGEAVRRRFNVGAQCGLGDHPLV